jgi:integrase
MDMAHDIDQRTQDIDQDSKTALATLSTATDLAALSRAETDQVTALVRLSKKPATQTAYQSDLRQVAAWLLAEKPALAARVVQTSDDEQGRAVATLCGPLPVEAVLAYIVAAKTRLAYPSLRRHLASLSAFHQLGGVANPCSDALVRAALSGVRREQQHRPKRAPAMRRSHLETIVVQLAFARDMASLRDYALLLVGWAGALRRSELAALTWGDVTNDVEGIYLDLRGAKTDSGDEGQTVALPFANTSGLCPVRTLNRWQSACIRHGLDLSTPEGRNTPVFCAISTADNLQIGRGLTGQGVGDIVQRRAVQAGFEPGFFTAHSLRAGLITEANAEGRSDLDIMATSRHRSRAVFATYVRNGEAMRRAASKGLL